MHQHHLNRREAFELLRKTSRSRRCKLDVLAKEIIASIEAEKGEFPAIN
jgi:AmiR/NasT family two-component response regulator